MAGLSFDDNLGERIGGNHFSAFGWQPLCTQKVYHILKTSALYAGRVKKLSILPQKIRLATQTAIHYTKFQNFTQKGVVKPPFFCYNMLSFAQLLASRFT
jgi:hypothetical protein